MLTTALLIFVIFFGAWVAFVILDGLNHAVIFTFSSRSFKKKLISLFEKPIHVKGPDGNLVPREACWEDVQDIARKCNLSVGQILFNLENMLSDATSSHGDKGEELRSHYHTLKSIIADCEQSKDLELLPKNIQTHLKTIKANAPQGSEAIFPLFERDILNLQTSNEEAFKKEKIKSMTSVVLAVIGVVIGLVSIIPGLETTVHNLFVN